jgi:hypothetical protein
MYHYTEKLFFKKNRKIYFFDLCDTSEMKIFWFISITDVILIFSIRLGTDMTLETNKNRILILHKGQLNADVNNYFELKYFP